MVRIYWNISSDKDGLVWSVDDGDQKNEVHVKKVLLEVVEMETGEDLKAEWPHPKGWLFSNDVKYWIDKDLVAHIEPIY